MSQITGQSIGFEPRVLGFKGHHPTRMERYKDAKKGPAKSKVETLNKKGVRGQPANAHTKLETVQRTLGQAPRKQVASAGLMQAPLISGMASDTSGGIKRRAEAQQHAKILDKATAINQVRIPHI